KQVLLKLGNPDQVEAILAKLAAARLISLEGGGLASPEGNFVEVSHEILIRGWPQLRDWVSEDRESLRAERRIAESARDWISANRDASALYTGRKLIQALQWSEGSGTELPTEIQEFLAASVGMRDREIKSLVKRRRSLFAIVFIVTALTTTAL